MVCTLWHISVLRPFVCPHSVLLDGRDLVLFLHSLAGDGYVGCFHLLAAMNNAAVNVCMQVFRCVFSFIFVLVCFLKAFLE